MDVVFKLGNFMNIELSLSLVNGILQYLGTRPYGEVVQIISAIQEQAGPQVKEEVVAEQE